MCMFGALSVFGRPIKVKGKVKGKVVPLQA
jgi:hypothetical protein